MTSMQNLPEPGPVFSRVAKFTRELAFEDLPVGLADTAALFILDLIGVMAAASQLDAGQIACNHAARHWAAGPGAPRARLPFDGRHVSLPGFAFAAATQIDNLDAHDGWQTSKGHAGAAIFPALLAFAEAEMAVSGREALLAMIVGYEISYRAAAALHATVPDYHTSGAWNALGCAAIGARLRHLDDARLRHALGIAEYHGPRSQMMREIANPSMLHDGTGWGAPTGVYALLVAEDGFTGAPAATVEFDDAAFAWADLGQNWLTGQQYIKPYPTCRWAHAAIDAVLELKRRHVFGTSDIAHVEIATFRYSAELNNGVPANTAIAQYSLAWPVAAALARGRVGVDEVTQASFSDPVILGLLPRINVTVSDAYEAAYPLQRLASVDVILNNGHRLQSGTTVASGGPEPQPTRTEVVEKYRAFAGPVLGKARTTEIERRALELTSPAADFKALIDLLIEPPQAKSNAAGLRAARLRAAGMRAAG